MATSFTGMGETLADQDLENKGGSEMECIIGNHGVFTRLTPRILP